MLFRSAMEDCFVAVQDGKETLVSARVDQLLEGTDFLRSLAGLEESAVESWSEENRPGIDALVERLRAEAPVEAGPAAGTGSETAPAAEPTSEPVADASTDDVAEEPEHSTPEDSPPDAPATPEPSIEEPSRAAAVETASPSDEDRVVRVDSTRLERMMQLAGEVMITSRRFAGVRRDAVQLDRRLDGLEVAVGEATRAHGDPRTVLRGEVDDARRDIAAMVDELEGLLRQIGRAHV